MQNPKSRRLEKPKAPRACEDIVSELPLSLTLPGRGLLARPSATAGSGASPRTLGTLRITLHDE